MKTHRFSETLGHRNEHSLGVYHPSIRTLLLFGKINPKETQDTLFHEAFHQYLHLAVDRAPWWFNEGYAEYFGAATFDKRWKATEGPVQTGRLRDLKAYPRIVSFEKIMMMGPREFMGGNVGLHYAQSWAMVHFFERSGNIEYKDVFDKYTAAILANKPAREAYDASFGADDAPLLSDMQAAFLRYVAKLK